MSKTVGVVVPWFLLALSACSGQPAAGDDERALAALVPTHSVVYARLQSLDAVAASSNAVNSALDQGGHHDGRQLLELLGSVAGATKLVDTARPLAFALVAPKATPPTPLLFVPCSNAVDYAASLQRQQLVGVVVGNYVVVSMGAKYELPTAPCPLCADLPPGLLSMRVDVATTAANLGVVIGGGLTAFRAAALGAMQQQPDTGFDVEAIVDLYLDAARALLANVASCELSVQSNAGQLQFAAALHAKAGGAMDGWGGAPIDVAPLAAKLSGKSPIDLVAAADWTRLWPRLEPVMTALFDIYPPSFREGMQKVMASYLRAYELAGSVFVGEGTAFGAEGLGLVVHMAPPDATALLAAVDEIVQRPELAQMGMQVTRVGGEDRDGAVLRDYTARMDVSKLYGEAVDGAAKEQAVKMVETLLGKDGVPVRVAGRNGDVVLTIGKTKVGAGPAGAPSPSLRAALAHVGDCNPMLIERLDMAALMRDGMQLLAPAAAERGLQVAAGTTAEVVVSGGIRGAEWRFGLAIDAAGLAKTFAVARPR